MSMFSTNTEKDYIDMMVEILEHGALVPTRTGTNCYTMPHAMLSYDMSDGSLPLMTHKKMGLKSISAELWCFLHGETSKKVFNEKGTSIWDEWCNPYAASVVNLSGEEKIKAMKNEDDLGKIYGHQWRRFNGNKTTDYVGNNFLDSGIDQISDIEKQLKTEQGKMSRRLLCSAWNPNQLDEMALPPCHFSWQVRVINNTLNLNWNQRSCDFGLGIPYNIASYGVLLALIADTHGLKRGKLTGFFSDCHVYENHVDGVIEASRRAIYKFPQFSFAKKYNSILEWEPSDNILSNYNCGEKIFMPIAV